MTTVTGNPPAASVTVTGLTNGTAYTFKVAATNALGTGALSSASAAVTPARVPDAPTGVSAVAGSGSATVSWTAPANGGSVITRYTVVPYIGGTAQTARTVTGTPPAASLVVTGLTNGTAYTFTVMATNAVGNGAVSAPSTAVTPTGVPGAPTGVVGVRGDGAVTVSWTAPVSNGGSGITGYTVTPFIGTVAQPVTTVTGNPPAASVTVTGLTNGTAYTFKVAATNALGTGALSSASAAVTPARVPDAPTGVSAVAGSGSATVSWTAPANGGSVITRYTVVPYIGGTAQTARTVTGTPPAASLVVTGLTNGTAYTFTVMATNAVGNGAVSAPSTAVTPFVPTFVQQVIGRSAAASAISVTPSNSVTVGNRLVVMVGVRNSTGPTAQSVTDSAGNTYIKLKQFTASDLTEMSIWTAPITEGGGTRPIITATPTGSAVLAIQALEYTGLSTVADASVVDGLATATGTTGTVAATVRSGPTTPTTAAGELAVGFYLDAGFGKTLTAGAGFTRRAGVSPTTDMEFLAEDQIPALSATPNAGVGTGAATTWLMATVVLKRR